MLSDAIHSATYSALRHQSTDSLLPVFTASVTCGLTNHTTGISSVPEKHAPSGVVDLTLDGLPRAYDGEQLALGERHGR